ncbi:arylesterase [Oricola nitratireducens]|uniref:arylesterase n=1 Tax=Oricola nitratireducens TaxID=2775868 RepID=UPI0018666199|nr:arylesterase [Oricola nitratireducens]
MFKVWLRIFLLAGLLFGAVRLAEAGETLSGVGFGDSLMAGYQLGPGEAFPDRLQAALRSEGHDVTIANAGVSGDTTADGLARLDWSVPDGTDFVILELGANDALRGLSPDITRANLDKMISRLKERGIDVILAGMLAPPNMGEDYAAKFDAIFPELAEKYKLPFHRFFLDGAITDRAKLLGDGMHPNPAGVDAMVAKILPVMRDYLAARGD